MARAVVLVLALTVCCLLVAPVPARHPTDLPPQVTKAAAGCAEEADQATTLTVPEEGNAIAAQEEGREQGSSLLCLIFRCGGEPASAVVARASSKEPAALDAWTQNKDVEDRQEGPYNSNSDCGSDWDSDSDNSNSDCDSDWDSDSDDEEGGIMGWFWRLAHLF
ncbi:uncharacterized protein LOC133892772 [Phragmites australis]|uniref:uncharacterized protein LOC133892772 n=1 Tax=Phragmites australis TaxID=29695 RepID=UPI002D765835|nr:uncharacterized protein LOC133892772 [Phragmites australis]